MNGVRDILTGGGTAPVPGSAAAAVAMPYGAGGQNGVGGGATVTNTSGGQTSLGRVQCGIAVGLLLAVAALILLNKAGFRFSATIG